MAIVGKNVKGEVQEGKFDKDTGLLIEGKIIFPDGRISDGRFDKDTGILIEGQRIDSNGTVEDFRFE